LVLSYGSFFIEGILYAGIHVHNNVDTILAELQHAKRASEAPWVRKIGNPSSRENLVMTSAYERPYVCTDSGGGGGASHGHPYGKLRNAIFPWRFLV